MGWLHFAPSFYSNSAYSDVCLCSGNRHESVWAPENFEWRSISSIPTNWWAFSFAFRLRRSKSKPLKTSATGRCSVYHITNKIKQLNFTRSNQWSSLLDYWISYYRLSVLQAIVVWSCLVTRKPCLQGVVGYGWHRGWLQSPGGTAKEWTGQSLFYLLLILVDRSKCVYHCRVVLFTDCAFFFQFIRSFIRILTFYSCHGIFEKPPVALVFKVLESLFKITLEIRS